MISQTAEYALRAVVYLGNEQGVPRTTAQIANAIDASAGYLGKVLQNLGRAGLVNAQRGLGGGFTLAQDAGDVSILDVVQAVDSLRRIRDCPLGKPAHTSGLCPLHRRIDDVMADAERAFGLTKIDQLLNGPGTFDLCQFPCISEPPQE